MKMAISFPFDENAGGGGRFAHNQKFTELIS